MKDKSSIGFSIIVITAIAFLAFIEWPRREGFSSNGITSAASASAAVTLNSLKAECQRRDLKCWISQDTDSWYASANAKDGARWYKFAKTEDELERTMLIHLNDKPDWPATLQQFDLN